MDNKTKQAMQMALEALEWYGDDWDEGKYKDVKKAQAALREVLAQPQGKWVDLTDYEIGVAFTGSPCLIPHQNQINGLRAVIAKFKEKNTPQVTPQVTPQGEPVAWIHRYKTGAEQINTAPPETYVGWSHTPLYTTPPSVEAAIEATKEKAAKVCESYIVEGIGREMAAAIRSMK